MEIFCALCHHCGEDDHLYEAEHEEEEEAIAEPIRREPSRCRHLARPSQGVSYLQEELSSSTIVVAISLSTSEYGHEQRNQKTDDSEPCEHNIEESEDEIGGRYEPQVITPFLIFLFCHANLFDEIKRVVINLGISSLVDADGILRTYFHANTTCHAAVLLVNCFILSHIVTYF